MDPFTVALGTLSIAEAALQSINVLIHDINAIKDAPGVMADLRDELAAMNAILITLDDARKDSKLEALTSDMKTALHLAVANCKSACDKFGTNLKRWRKHSDDKFQWWDRVRIGLFAEATIKSLSEQLNRCKSTVNVAVSTATLLTTATSTPITGVMQRGLHTKEIEIRHEITEIDKQNGKAAMALQKVNALRPTDDKDDPSELIKQLHDQHVALDASRKLLEDLLSETHHMRTGQKITKVEMTDGGKLLVGLINAGSEGGEVHQEIHDIKATNAGKGVVGMANGFDVNAFFKD